MVKRTGEKYEKHPRTEMARQYNKRKKSRPSRTLKELTKFQISGLTLSGTQTIMATLFNDMMLEHTKTPE